MIINKNLYNKKTIGKLNLNGKRIYRDVLSSGDFKDAEKTKVNLKSFTL